MASRARKRTRSSSSSSSASSSSDRCPTSPVVHSSKKRRTVEELNPADEAKDLLVKAIQDGDHCMDLALNLLAQRSLVSEQRVHTPFINEVLFLDPYCLQLCSAPFRPVLLMEPPAAKLYPLAFSSLGTLLVCLVHAYVHAVLLLPAECEDEHDLFDFTTNARYRGTNDTNFNITLASLLFENIKRCSRNPEKNVLGYSFSCCLANTLIYYDVISTSADRAEAVLNEPVFQKAIQDTLAAPALGRLFRLALRSSVGAPLLSSVDGDLHKKAFGPLVNPYRLPQTELDHQRAQHNHDERLLVPKVAHISDSSTSSDSDSASYEASVMRVLSSDRFRQMLGDIMTRELRYGLLRRLKVVLAYLLAGPKSPVRPSDMSSIASIIWEAVSFLLAGAVNGGIISQVTAITGASTTAATFGGWLLNLLRYSMVGVFGFLAAEVVVSVLDPAKSLFSTSPTPDQTLSGIVTGGLVNGIVFYLLHMFAIINRSGMLVNALVGAVAFYAYSILLYFFE